MRPARPAQGSDGKRVARRAAVYAACAFGLVHAASSLYWALGGRWLLSTVGNWAVDIARRSPLEISLALGAIGLLKAVAAVLPMAIEFGRVRAPFWRFLCWAGGIGLLAYGGMNVVASNAVLIGLARPTGGYDREAMVGHAVLWGPLFLLWGLSLTVWLGMMRSSRRSAT
jgi:hypothetical protein